jgi:hypothetical protein
MANLNYNNGDAFLGGGVTAVTFFYGPIDARYNEISIAPDPASNANGNVQIVSKWVVATPQEIDLYHTITNNSPDPVWFAWNAIEVAP